jgi:hypothetical protein
MKTLKAFLFTVVLTLALFGIAHSDIADDCTALEGKYQVVIMKDGPLARQMSEKCNCRVWVDQEHMLVIVFDIPKNVCI